MTGIPNRMFISVDLPAPFSPSTAWISPGLTRRLTRSLALTAGYCLLRPRSSRRRVMGSPRGVRSRLSAVRVVGQGRCALEAAHAGDPGRFEVALVGQGQPREHAF